jgi:ferredoxin-NADP reductase
MRYETWWSIHLYAYLAAALSLPHQLTTGASFLGHPWARVFWLGLWLSTAGVVLACRVGLPLWRSFRHRIRVVRVRDEAPGVVSVILTGHRLDRLPVAGGQFLQWRFMKRGLWWQAHPYSLSALPTKTHARITVRTDGDHGRELAALSPGTRVVIEGPYGTFTTDSRTMERVVLIGAGVGSAPVRALLDDLPREVDVVVLLRGSEESDLVLRDEITRLVEQRGGRLHELVGPRHRVRLDADVLRWLVPDIVERDLYVCGPRGFLRSLLRAARSLGVPSEQIHYEDFAI